MEELEGPPEPIERLRAAAREDARTDRRMLLLAGIAVTVTLCAVGWRMQRGFDYTDESYYIAMPARFVMGDRPYVDELNIGQNAGIFLWPFLAVFHAIVKSWTGVFAFVRGLYVLFFACVGFHAFRLVRACHVGRGSALLVAGGCLTFIPYGLPGLSYNTLGAGFFAMGTFECVRALLEKDPPTYRIKEIYKEPLFRAGFLLGCGVFAYPGLVLPVLVSVLAVSALAPNRKRSFVLLAVGGLAVGLVLSPIFISAGSGNLRAVLKYSFSETPQSNGNLLTKLVAAWKFFHDLNPKMWVGFVLTGITTLAARSRPRYAGWLLFLIPFYMYVPAGIPNSLLSYYIRFAVSAPLFTLALDDRKLATNLAIAGWFPSIVAAIAVSLSSGNSAGAAGIGLFPAAIVSAALLASWAKETMPLVGRAKLSPALQLVPLGFLLLLTRYMLSNDAVYRDAPLNLLTERFTEGPFAGLYSVQDRKVFLSQIRQDIRVYGTGNHISFWYDFPIGYLYADLPPHTASVWNFGYLPVRAAMEAEMMARKIEMGEAVFRVGGGWNPSAPLDAGLQACCTHVASGPNYSIWMATPKLPGIAPVPVP